MKTRRKVGIAATGSTLGILTVLSLFGANRLGNFCNKIGSGINSKISNPLAVTLGVNVSLPNSPIPINADFTNSTVSIPNFGQNFNVSSVNLQTNLNFPDQSIPIQLDASLNTSKLWEIITDLTSEYLDNPCYYLPLIFFLTITALLTILVAQHCYFNDRIKTLEERLDGEESINPNDYRRLKSPGSP